MLLTLDSLEEIRLEANLADALSSRARYRLTFEVGEVAVGIAMSDGAAFDDFRYRFGDLSVERAPDYTFYAVDDGRNAYFWSDANRVRSWIGESLAPSALSFLADNAAMSDFFFRNNYIGLHAAVLSSEYGMCALLGSTTAGKTTTAIACVRRGFRLYSDERCILHDRGVYAFARALTIRAGGRQLLAIDGSDDEAFLAAISQWGDVSEVSVRPSQLFPGRVGGPLEPLRAIFLLDGQADYPIAKRVSLPTVVPQIAESMSSASSGLDRVARILSTLKSVECYRLRLGRPDDTARLISKVMAR